jgi:Inosine-uridine preferring nucleoside hydrolase
MIPAHPMRRPRLSLLVAGALLLASPALAQGPVRVIVDTDLAADVDDVGALALLHALADRGEAEILATMVSSRNRHSVACLSALNSWYGRRDLPIGTVRAQIAGYPKDTGGTVESKYTEEIAKRFPLELRSTKDAQDAVPLYRRTLAGQADGSVVIVTIGFLTNLKNLLDSAPDDSSPLGGEDLVRRKVRVWVCMGGKLPDGLFPDGGSEYNVGYDTFASVRAINDWPTPVVFSGFEIGASIKTGARLNALPDESPVKAAYRLFNGLLDRESWDQTAVLYAVRGARDYWRESPPGLNLMHARVGQGFNEWLDFPAGRHRHLQEKMSPGELARTIEELMLQPPRLSSRR